MNQDPNSVEHRHELQGQALVHAHQGGDQPHGYYGHPEDAWQASQVEPGEDVKVAVKWTEVVTREAVRNLDATRMRRLGYDPRDPESIARYLKAADDFEGDDWYPWHSEFSQNARRTDTADAEISSVTIEPS